MKNQRAFTLVEAMTVVAVVGLVLAMAAPSFRDLIMNNRLSTQTNYFIASLNYARSEAIKRRQPVDVTAVSAADWADGFNVTLPNAGDTVVWTVDALPNGLTLIGDVNAIQFQPTGFSNAGARFELCDSRTGEFGRVIRITRTGRVVTADEAFQCQ